MMTQIAAFGDVPPGTARRITVGGHVVALFNVAGGFYAVDDRCPHEGGRLSWGPSKRASCAARSTAPASTSPPADRSSHRRERRWAHRWIAGWSSVRSRRSAMKSIWIFDQDAVGTLPQGFTPILGSWSVRLDASAPSPSTTRAWTRSEGGHDADGQDHRARRASPDGLCPQAPLGVALDPVSDDDARRVPLAERGSRHQALAIWWRPRS